MPRRARVSPGRDDPGPVVSAATDPSIAPDDELPVVVGQFIQPSPTRRRWWSRHDCEVCGQEHLHADPRRPGQCGWLRYCPTTGKPYRVVVGRG